jgi:hypothetical protein
MVYGALRQSKKCFAEVRVDPVRARQNRNLDRKGLEECAYECYAAIRERIDSVVTRERHGAL